jgi:hypothetical protein
MRETGRRASASSKLSFTPRLHDTICRGAKCPWALSRVGRILCSLQPCCWGECFRDERALNALLRLAKVPRENSRSLIPHGLEHSPGPGSDGAKGHRLDSRQRESRINQLLTAESHPLRCHMIEEMRERVDYFRGFCGDGGKRRLGGGEGGIRTPETLSSLHAFQACALNRARPPLRARTPIMHHAVPRNQFIRTIEAGKLLRRRESAPGSES